MFDIMSKKLNSMPDYQARMPRQPHNLSQNFTFTASTGMELPCYYDMLHVGDEIFFNSGMFARLNPIYAPFIGDVDIHLDYFFVPLSVMFTPSLSMFYQTDDLLYQNSWSERDHFPIYSIAAALDNIKRNGLNQAAFRNHDGTMSEFYLGSFDSHGKCALRLCDLLEYNPLDMFVESNTRFNPDSTPWFLAAYHACHQLYFRNDDREPKSYLYQLDLYSESANDNQDSGELLTLNYRSAYKDYFNSVKVSPIGSSVSMLRGADSWNMLSKVNSYLFGSDYMRQSFDARETNQTGPSTFGSISDSIATSVGKNGEIVTPFDGTNYGINAANIRQLFMVDKMLRITGRADKNYESQFLAHFGIKLPHDELHNITHIGHDMFTLNTQTIQSTANTYNSSTGTGSSLGEIGGQGYVSGSGKKRKFKAPFHGVFMCIFSAVPRYRYCMPHVNKLHDLSDPMSFWQPEYDKRGMQPLFRYECGDFTSGSQRVGWQYGYEQFKRKYDRASLAFRNPDYNHPDTVNMYSPWVLSRQPYGKPDGSTIDSLNLTWRSLLSTPHDLDGVMMVQYQSVLPEGISESNYHTAFQTDPFIINYQMQCKKVNCMSEYSEPPID